MPAPQTALFIWEMREPEIAQTWQEFRPYQPLFRELSPKFTATSCLIRTALLVVKKEDFHA
jgi:hypothetical protein